MALENNAIIAFNRGIVSDLALARADVERVSQGAVIQDNIIPRSLGSASLRAGRTLIGETDGNKESYGIPFVFSRDDSAYLEITDSTLRIWVDDSLIERVTSPGTIVNPDMTLTTGWVDDDELAATSEFLGNQLRFTGGGDNAARRYQDVAISNTATPITFRIDIAIGPLRVRILQNATDVIFDAYLQPGVHSLQFVPDASSLRIELSHTEEYTVRLNSFSVESAGILELPLPYAAADLSKIRFTQSGDVVYLGCDGYKQIEIQRRGLNSYAVVDFLPTNGPFGPLNDSGISITANSVRGTAVLTASEDYFTAEMVGQLIRLRAGGQVRPATLAGNDQSTDDIRVTGIEESRRFGIIITGAFSGTITLQSSVGGPGVWNDVQSYTSAVQETYLDGFDNQIIHYRLTFKDGDYTSGSPVAQLDFAGGSSEGVVRITDFTDKQTVTGAILSLLGSTESTKDFSLGAWGDESGYPSCPLVQEGRLWWFGANKIYGSVSDGYRDYDDDEELGDAGTVQRSIGRGPVNDIEWSLGLQRMLLGTTGNEVSVRSSSFDEPITPTNFNVRIPSTQGCAPIDAVQVDMAGIFVQRSGIRVFALLLGNGGDYQSSDLMLLAPELAEAGIKRLAVQRQPDTRIHVVLNDGTALLLLFDPAEDLKGWFSVSGSGTIEDVLVLPGNTEDRVYYTVARTIDGVQKRYIERWAQETETRGAARTVLSDATIVYSGASTTTLTGLSALEGEDVVIWGNGKDLGGATVVGGSITLTEAVTECYVGLPYVGRYKSTLLTTRSRMGTTLLQRNMIGKLALMLRDTHPNGIKYGPDFDHLEPLPQVVDGEVIDPDTILAEYEADAVEFNDTYSVNSRLCFEMESPRPCTVLAAVLSVRTHEKR